MFKLYSILTKISTIFPKPAQWAVSITTVYAAPETGFTVTYQSKFNDYPAVGEAQLYDALLHAGFAIKLPGSGQDTEH